MAHLKKRKWNVNNKLEEKNLALTQEKAFSWRFSLKIKGTSFGSFEKSF